jgi:hypothetical protein
MKHKSHDSGHATHTEKSASHEEQPHVEDQPHIEPHVDPLHEARQLADELHTEATNQHTHNAPLTTAILAKIAAIRAKLG